LSRSKCGSIYISHSANYSFCNYSDVHGLKTLQKLAGSKRIPSAKGGICIFCGSSVFLGRFGFKSDTYRHATGGHDRRIGHTPNFKMSPIKGIGGKAMLSFAEPDTTIEVLGKLLQAGRKEPRQPLTRAGLNLFPIIRRAGDLRPSTLLNRAGLASLVQLLAAQPIAEAAGTSGILVRDLGTVVSRALPLPGLSPIRPTTVKKRT
jgi:hypothetical protein